MNLSHNSIFGEFTNTGLSEDETKKAAKAHEYEIFHEDKDQLAVFGEALENLTDFDKMDVENLCKFIKRNSHLLHVDVSYVGLSEIQLWYFGRTLRRAKSIRSLHASGNRTNNQDSITPRLKAYLLHRIHPIP